MNLFPQNCITELFRKLTQITRLSRVVGLLPVILMSACTRGPAPSPEFAFRETAPTEISDDTDFSGLIEAIDKQRPVLQQDPDKPMQFGPVVITRAQYVAALDRLTTMLRGPSSLEEKISFIRGNFRFFEIYGDRRWGEVLLTSYYEPIIKGSTKPSPQYPYPLYAKPSDLVTIDLKSFAERFKGENSLKGRIFDGKVVPFYTREEIDAKGALRGKQLELCWVDPIEAFFLHIQGSGTVKLEDGKEIFVTYADKNGHRYEAIGKFLKERIAPRAVTMQRVEAALRAMPARERDQLLYKNPSYVFFTLSAKRAITSLGIPATPGRTIAVDPKFAPKGALALLSFAKPILEKDAASTSDPIGALQVSRLVLDQDSGGAITGTGRVDLFWGRGDEAKRYAGIMQHRARLFYLAPR